jgi:hypothetical protein
VCIHHRGINGWILHIFQITRVHFPGPLNGRDRKIAYVEFGDEETMKAGLEKHKEVCSTVSLSMRSTDCIFSFQELNGGTPEVKQSDRERDYHTFRGGRGRGGHHRGGFARRGFAEVGLVRGGTPKTTNGDT